LESRGQLGGWLSLSSGIGGPGGGHCAEPPLSLSLVKLLYRHVGWLDQPDLSRHALQRNDGRMPPYRSMAFAYLYVQRCSTIVVFTHQEKMKRRQL
jgi:hypothetical protein